MSDCDICAVDSALPCFNKPLLIDSNVVMAIVRELKKNNPYPADVFISKKGHAARHAWNVALISLVESLIEFYDKNEVIKHE